jgi:Zn-dependent protease with chaperone function
VITALALLGYAACAAWCVPALLAPLTRRGVSVRAGLAAWLAAMGCVLLSAAVAIELSFRTVAADWPQLTQALCRSVAGGACTPAVYRSALYEGGAAAVAIAATLLAAVALWRYGRRVQRSRAQTRSHARAALLVGRAIAVPAAGVAGSPAGAAGGLAAGPARPAGRARTVMLDDPRPAAYCVAGRPAAIVVTSGALAVLDPPQLGAVLAHENAHLAHGHHALATVTRGLAAAFPGVPLFARGAAEVARLAEMSADDTAARTSGRPALVAALIAIATGTVVPSTAVASTGVLATGVLGTGVPLGAMAAAARAVPDRVERLLRPSSPARSAAFTATLTLVLAVLAAAPPALTLLVGR